MYRVLIADDDDGVREILRIQVERLGHTVLAEARNGREAVDFANQHHPDMAILDIRMPVMDGIDAANEILETAPCAVIFLTAFAEEDMIARAGESGAFYYLVKPFRSEELAPAMALSMARFHQYQEARRLLEKAKQDLADRKTIERAKGMLMQLHGLSEQDAFSRIHFAARSKNKTTVAVAEEVISTGTIPS